MPEIDLRIPHSVWSCVVDSSTVTPLLLSSSTQRAISSNCAMSDVFFFKKSSWLKITRLRSRITKFQDPVCRLSSRSKLLWSWTAVFQPGEALDSESGQTPSKIRGSASFRSRIGILKRSRGFKFVWQELTIKNLLWYNKQEHLAPARKSEDCLI